MDFVKSLSMFHVDAKEIPCLTGEGAPAEKTEGAPGVLYMDTLTGTLYKCRAADLVNGLYTWEEASGKGSSQNVNLTAAQINALDGMFKVCAYDDSKDVSGAYAAFKTAFGITDSGGNEGDEEEPDTPVEPDEPEATLTEISAVYSGGDVPIGTAVTSLTGIVVTAHYSDGSSKAVSGYALSGTIVEGSNTITVTYQGMTTTFTVTGVAESGGDSGVDAIDPVSGYTFYDYITNPESSNDYVATGLTHSPSFGVLSTRFWVKPKTISRYAALFGGRTTAGLKDDNAGFGCWIASASKIEFGVLGQDFISETALTTDAVNEVAYKFVDGGVSTATINGVVEEIATVSKADFATNTAPLYINSYNKNGTISNNIAPNEYELGRIIMSDGENAVYDFVPAYEEASAEYGYYERINGVFYPCHNSRIICGNWG